MLRKFASAVVVLALCAGLSLAADKAAKGKKKGKGVSGTIKKIDAATGTLTVAVKKKKATAEQEFKIDDATKVVVFAGDKKEELAGKAALKNPEVKEGARVTVVTGEDGKVTEIRIGTPPKKKKNK